MNKPNRKELEKAIDNASHDYRVGNTVNPHDFDDIIQAAQYLLNFMLDLDNMMEGRGNDV